MRWSVPAGGKNKNSYFTEVIPRTSNRGRKGKRFKEKGGRSLEAGQLKILGGEASSAAVCDVRGEGAWRKGLPCERERAWCLEESRGPAGVRGKAVLLKGKNEASEEGGRGIETVAGMNLRGRSEHLRNDNWKKKENRGSTSNGRRKIVWGSVPGEWGDGRNLKMREKGAAQTQNPISSISSAESICSSGQKNLGGDYGEGMLRLSKSLPRTWG